MTLVIAFGALVAELAFGYPRFVQRRIGHPVQWIGALIDRLDQAWNRDTDDEQTRRRMGVLALVAILIAAILPTAALQSVLLALPFGIVPLALIAGSLFAQRSLHAHVVDVARALEGDGVEAGRRAVARIVGRDPDALDEAGIARAAIESLSENFSDGVVAPAIWAVIGGLPGAAAYKAINTADSMIGHRDARHLDFGRAAARFDDLINLPASRASALLIVAAAWFMSDASPRRAWQTVLRDARRHRSPNAGWPEAAMAGALGLAIAGPRQYDGAIVNDATMGEGGRRDANAADITRALHLYRLANGLLLAVIGLALLLIAHG